MATPLIYDLGTIDIGVGGETSPLKFCEQYGWNIASVVTGTPGIAKYTVRVSDDNITYYNYKTASTLVDIVNAVQDETFNWLWIKVLVVPGGTSSGSAQFTLLLKR